MISLVVAISAVLATAAPQEDLVESLLRLQAVPKREAPKQNAQSRRQVPPDDVPLETLVRFWGPSEIEMTAMNIRGEGLPAPSNGVRERLLEAVIAKPDTAPRLLKWLPRTPAAHERLKRLHDDSTRSGESGRNAIKRFLMLNSAYFRDELIELANTASDRAGSTLIDHGEELAALATLDWPLAEPLLKRFAEGEMPRRALIAKTILYAHYPDGLEADSLNAELRKTVSDTGALSSTRVSAIQALLDRNWSGRDEWFQNLFHDNSLREVREGNTLFRPLAQSVGKDPDRWIPVVAKLVGNPDRAVHDNAVTCLIQFRNDRARRDALEPLLPWLLDPAWSSARDRLRLIQSMKVLDLRESIPGLIAVLNQSVEVAERGYAADALAHFGDPRAVPELRRALPATSGSYRQMFVAALVASGGLEDAEVVSGLESFARTMGRPEASRALVAQLTDWGPGGGPAELAATGLTLAAQTKPPAESALARLLARVKELERTEPLTAEALLSLIYQWPTPVVTGDLVKRIETNTTPATALDTALRRRDKQTGNLAEAQRAAANSSGFASGIFAVLLSDSRLELDILRGSDTVAIRALFASARLAGETLPVDAVERIYTAGSSDAQRAAEAYLTANDSPSARQILNARFKGSVIFGAQESFGGASSSPNPLAPQEGQILALMQVADAPDEVFALLNFAGSSWTGTTNGEQIFIQRRGDTATLTRQGSRTQNGPRTLSKEEFNKLKTFLDSEKVEDLGPAPMFAIVSDFTSLTEYVHLTRSSGRRVYMMTGYDNDSVYGRLVEQFHSLASGR